MYLSCVICVEYNLYAAYYCIIIIDIKQFFFSLNCDILIQKASNC